MLRANVSNGGSAFKPVQQREAEASTAKVSAPPVKVKQDPIPELKQEEGDENIEGSSFLPDLDQYDQEVWAISVRSEGDFIGLEEALAGANNLDEVKSVLFAKGGVFLISNVLQLRWLLTKYSPLARAILFDYGRVDVIKTAYHLKLMSDCLSPTLMEMVLANKRGVISFDSAKLDQYQASFNDLKMRLKFTGEGKIADKKEGAIRIFFCENGMATVNDISQLLWLLRFFRNFSHEILFTYGKLDIITTADHLAEVLEILPDGVDEEVLQAKMGKIAFASVEQLFAFIDNYSSFAASFLFDCHGIDLVKELKQFGDLLEKLPDEELVGKVLQAKVGQINFTRFEQVQYLINYYPQRTCLMLFDYRGLDFVKTSRDIAILNVSIKDEVVLREISTRFPLDNDKAVMRAVRIFPGLAQSFLFERNGISLLTQADSEKLLTLPLIDEGCKEKIRAHILPNPRP